MHEGDTEATQKLGNSVFLSLSLILLFLGSQSESHNIMEELALFLAIDYR